MSFFYIYIVECKDKSLYCGVAKNLEKRMEEHNKDNKKGAKYTRSRRPVKLVYVEKHENYGKALKREIEIKKMNKLQKLQLISALIYPSSA